MKSFLRSSTSQDWVGINLDIEHDRTWSSISYWLWQYHTLLSVPKAEKSLRKFFKWKTCSELWLWQWS